jgi:hypothetical protein
MSNIIQGIAQKKMTGTAVKKAVLMYMANCASDDGTGIWTSKTNMASDLEVSRRAVQLAITAFIDAGVVAEVGKRKCKNGFTVEYQINIPLLDAMPSTREPHSHVNPVHVTCEPHSHQDVNPIRTNLPLTTPEPSIEENTKDGLFTDDLAPPKQDPKLDRFDEFWAAYPKCQNKRAPKRARTIWAKIMSGKSKGIEKESPDVIIAAVKRYAASNSDFKFAFNPARWLDEREWTEWPEQVERRRGGQSIPYFGEITR